MITFNESQKFRQWWIYAILLTVIGIFGYGIFKQFILNEPWGSKPTSTAILLSVLIFQVLLLVLFQLFRLDTEINDQGVSYRFFPLQSKYKTIPWIAVQKAYIRKYSPIGEYGGWGLRYGGKERGRAYNISGNIGLQLELKDGSKILIGTQKSEELEALLKKML
jgi:hypothetical protein